MKEAKRSKKMFLGAVAVAVMMLVSATSAMSLTNTTEKTTTAHVIPAIDKAMPGTGLLNNGNVLVSSDNPGGDDQHPRITLASGGVPVVTYEKVASVLQKNAAVCYSSDGGASWTMKFDINSADLDGSGVLEWPAVLYNPNTDDIFFTADDPASEYPGFFGWIPGDIANADQMKYLNAFNDENPIYNSATYIGDWTVWFHIYDYSTGSAFEVPGLRYMTYDDNDQTFKFPNQVNPDWIAGSYYDGESVLKTSPASNPEIDAGSERMYMVMEHYNETTGRSEVAYKETLSDINEVFTHPGEGRGGMDKYADVEIWPWQGYMGKGDLFDSGDPDVATSGSNAVVVYETTDNIYGDWDIKCTYTSDNGETWQTSVVAENHPADDTHPAVYMSGNTVFCVYVSSGNLYLAKSEDGGATWGAPEQINEQDGTVVAEDGAVDINAGGIVWTDNRNGDKDIYYQSLPVAVVGVGTISGGMGVTATVDNTGSEDASNVDWSIKLSGLVFMGGETTGTIDTLAAGSETTVSTGLVGPTTITVTAGGASKTASAFLLGPMVLGVK